MNFDEYEKLDAKGKAEVEKKLGKVILERIPKGDETERVFEKRWVVSLYIRHIPKPKPKKKRRPMIKAVRKRSRQIRKEN